MKAIIVGSGNVAEGLAREIAEGSSGIELVQRWARKSHTPAELAKADLYIIAVSDNAVAEVSEQLPFAEGSVVAHTAGSVAMSDLSTKIAHRAVLYPLQSFTRGRRVADFRRTPFFVEGATTHALETVRTVAEALSDSVTEMSSERRAHLHLAGTFANNFTNAMLSLAETIAREAGETFDTLKPLIAETTAKALSMPSPREAQTGPAKRGDRNTQARHLATLAEHHPELTEIYEKISETIWKISKRN
ncbi:MAG: DUF2520 domain-containing protein [Alistipes sp.]|jgi:predicted short-subunit dehydrogenase-like oxidoreductase (DUF2520 family)|nr:DUF2520 domain-containing protein [Alistipes sp.]